MTCHGRYATASKWSDVAPFERLVKGGIDVVIGIALRQAGYRNCGNYKQRGEACCDLRNCHAHWFLSYSLATRYPPDRE